jgi:AbrB family looped-hinge helix DNA binding protein
MATAEKLTTIVSTKGQVILPKAIRGRRNWGPGTRLTVEETADGVLLRSAPLFALAEPCEVFGRLRYNGPPLSIEEMDAAVMGEARRRWHAGD